MTKSSQTKRRKRKRKSNTFVGGQKENQAAAYLRSKQFKILSQNFRLKHKEIDIIALDTVKNEIAFVEVKFRSKSQFGHPSQAVNLNKLRNIQQAALAYLDRHQIDKDFRFDIISILPDKIEHLPNISWQF